MFRNTLTYKIGFLEPLNRLTICKTKITIIFLMKLRFSLFLVDSKILPCGLEDPLLDLRVFTLSELCQVGYGEWDWRWAWLLGLGLQWFKVVSGFIEFVDSRSG